MTKRCRVRRFDELGVVAAIALCASAAGGQPNPANEAPPAAPAGPYDEPVPAPTSSASAAAPAPAATPATTLSEQPPPPPPSSPVAPPAVQAPPDCRQTALCHDQGLCTAWQGRCVAYSNAECQASRVCREYGACVAQSGVCGRSACRETEECREEGRCTPRDGGCVATSLEDCRASRTCMEDGECMLQIEKHRCTDGEDFRSRGAVIGGAISLGIGALFVAVGAVSMVEAENYRCDSLICTSPDDEDFRIVGITSFIIGGAGLAIGIPLLIYGAPKVQDEHVVTASVPWQPEISVGPTGGSMRWRF